MESVRVFSNLEWYTSKITDYSLEFRMICNAKTKATTTPLPPHISAIRILEREKARMYQCKIMEFLPLLTAHVSQLQ